MGTVNDPSPRPAAELSAELTGLEARPGYDVAAILDAAGQIECEAQLVVVPELIEQGERIILRVSEERARSFQVGTGTAPH